MNNLKLEHDDVLIGPHQIAFDLTNKCNLRCLHCFNFSGENIVIENELSDESVIEFMTDLSSLSLLNICFCGGEPLLRLQLLLECIRIIKENGITQVSLTTNGMLFTDEIAKKLSDLHINTFQVSIDGSTAEHHDRMRQQSGAFEKAVNAVKIASEYGFNVSVAFTPTAFNINDFEDLYFMLYKLNPKIRVRLQPLMLLGRTNRNLSILPTDYQYRNLVRTINKIRAQEKSIVIEWGDPVDHLIRFSQINTNGVPVNFLNIRANGDIVVSPYLPLVVGNIKRHSIQEYWNRGLNKVWSKNIAQCLANKILSIEDMSYIENDLPVVFKDNDIFIDLIENDLDDMSLLSFATPRQ